MVGCSLLAINLFQIYWVMTLLVLGTSKNGRSAPWKRGGGSHLAEWNIDLFLLLINTPSTPITCLRTSNLVVTRGRMWCGIWACSILSILPQICVAQDQGSAIGCTFRRTHIGRASAPMLASRESFVLWGLISSAGLSSFRELILVGVVPHIRGTSPASLVCQLSKSMRQSLLHGYQNAGV